MKKVISEKIGKYFSKIKAVKLVYLYGSQARNDAKENSDIDLAVLFDDSKGDSLKIQIESASLLEDLLNKKIEVQNLNVIDIVFAYRVISEGKLLYAKDQIYKVRYEERVLRQYFDLKPLFDEFDTHLEERARNKLLGRTYEYLQGSL
ncbi:hypothetical protein A2960_03130 [Candidatus Gottesmanbacteria bacterium RIFCSPLOWO2_01_FULL_39_12b]|uniref:Polymerase beta nucleotidyltransferase domain-containing protein n=1 Tax=Candidatus Gottesmanbacteria bacterium RIFCSPLOWO2_01_FULL_39_12b TaxID=1798388 RepID=A0A1F6AQY3_9BACT|nr:MAG: hypothetical protein A2960_03130 [Candidatus Gottesmanbacteria bacterium RIFCSPLOWO2_01_FULL_39_12b]